MQRILRVLGGAGPLSADEIAQRAHVARTSLVSAGYLRCLRAAGLIHVAGWARHHNGFTIALYAPGDAPDCPRPRFGPLDRDSAGMARLVATLAERPGLDYLELAEATGLSAHTLRGARYLDILVQQARVHICGWRRSRNGPPRALYRAGAGENVPRPAKADGAERSRRHRERTAALSGALSSVRAQLARIET
jgi:predicted ArsR family transcriptional regulator